MSISSLSGTPSQSSSGFIASQYAHHKRGFNEPVAPASIVPAGSSANNASQLVAAVAMAMTQLGLTTPGTMPAASKIVTTASDSGDADASNDTPLASPPQKEWQQVRQYQNGASTFSHLAQALSYTSNGTLLTSTAPGNLTTVFQNLWSSLGASYGTSVSASDAIPSLPSFLQTLAQNFGESGISGLRGMFVDTVA